jgi:DNA-binding response OmpR family regulator
LDKSVLVIDEDPEVLAFLTHLFEAQNLRVLRARSPSEALDILSREYVSVDLILANLMIARMDELASARPGVAVLYMTAFVDSGVIRIEAMNRFNATGFSTADERGVLDAVLSAVSNRGARSCGV